MKLQLRIHRFKLLITAAALLLLFFPALSCAEGTGIENKNTQQQNGSASTGESQLKIKLTVATTGGEKAVYATLYDNSVSRDLLSRLPLTLEFSDYNRTEKIARLPPGTQVTPRIPVTLPQAILPCTPPGETLRCFTGTTALPGDWFPWENLTRTAWNFFPPKPETLPWKFQPANKREKGQKSKAFPNKTRRRL